MNIILFSRRIRGVTHLNLGHPLAKGLIVGGLVMTLGLAFTFGMQFGQRSIESSAGGLPAHWSQRIAEQQLEVEQVRAQVQQRIDGLAARLGLMNAHVIRLDALGKRLTKIANIDDREFNFDVEPATGGPEAAGIGAEIPDLSALISNFEARLSLRDAQLSTLEQLIMQRELREQIMPDGRPVRRGFISSYFGDRQDPFSGHQSFHRGVDFAGQFDDDVIAVAAGVVTFSGERAGYGNVVEITHGDGYVTRYGHNKSNVVQLGETVTRGHLLARMGSTGRSTGPHLHFEVLRNGRQVNPLTYIND